MTILYTMHMVQDALAAQGISRATLTLPALSFDDLASEVVLLVPNQSYALNDPQPMPMDYIEIKGICDLRVERTDDAPLDELQDQSR